MFDFFKKAIEDIALGNEQYSTMKDLILNYYKAMGGIDSTKLEEGLKNIPKLKLIKDLEARMNYLLGEIEDLKA